MDHYEGEWVGEHHQWQVPEEAKGYLVFTLVRNPYDREMSAWYFIPWSAPEDRAPMPVEDFAEGMRQTAKYRDGTVVIEGHETPEVRMNQANYVKRADVKKILHFERLPECLKELPFIDPNNMAPFPHKEERGVRPKGGFFEHFRSAEDEAGVWAYANEDFEAFGYRRYDSGGPKSVDPAS